MPEGPLTDETLAAALVRGPTPVRVELVDHDPRWAERYAERAAELRRVLGDRARLVEHVGSTSVPGLAAKPIVDIVVGIDDPDDEPSYLPDLEAVGYDVRVRQPGHRCLRAGEPDGEDPSAGARAVLERAGYEPGAAAAAAHVAGRFGRGVAGLVNAHDPDVVVVGGLGPELRAAAPDAFAAAYDAGLMALHRERPVPVRDAAHGDDAVLRGAAEVALDEATSAAGLASFEESRQSVS